MKRIFIVGIAFFCLLLGACQAPLRKLSLFNQNRILVKWYPRGCSHQNLSVSPPMEGRVDFRRLAGNGFN